MNTSVSFIIPAYNAEKTLAEAVDSIYAGNFESGDEVIIVDDCSTDTTGAVAQTLSRTYGPTCTVIKNTQNKGCPASRNVGITQAKNSLIFNLDSDNILVPRSIAVLKKNLIEKNADVTAFQEYHYFMSDTRHLTHMWICNAGIFSLADIFAGMVNPAPGGNYLYRKSVWERVGGYWEYGNGLQEAWGFSLKILLAGAVFYVVPDTFYLHRHSHQSLFVTENKKAGEGISVSNKFIAPALDILDEASRSYVMTRPSWFDVLDIHPLYLKNGVRGRNGRVAMVSVRYRMSHLVRKIFKPLL